METTSQSNSYLLLGIVQRYAPNGTAQEQAASIYRDMQKAGETEDSLALSMAQIISDGLHDGNWPWTE